MLDGHRRWTLLAVLAAGNLALWLSVACLVGMCAGDGMDLGVETLARHAQATAVASWEKAMSRNSPRPAGEGSAQASRPDEQDAASSSMQPPAAVTVSLEENRSPLPSAAESLPPDDVSPDSGDSSDARVPLPPSTAGLQVAGSPQATASLKAAGSPEPGTEPLAPTTEVAAPPATTGPVSAALHAVAATGDTAPLLLVDPEFHSLAVLNSEMDRSGPERAVQIRFQEETLNQELAAVWHNNPALPYSDVRVDLHDNGVAISGRVTVLGFEVEALLEGTVVAEDCVPRLEVESVSLAGVTTPRFVRAQVVALANEAMAWYPADYPLCLEEIVLEEARATFYGHSR